MPSSFITGENLLGAPITNPSFSLGGRADPSIKYKNCQEKWGTSGNKVDTFLVRLLAKLLSYVSLLASALYRDRTIRPRTIAQIDPPKVRLVYLS